MFFRRLHNLATAACICLSLLTSANATAAEMQVTSRQNGPQITVEGWLSVAVDTELAWSVLSDYEQFPAFVPGIRVNRILKSTPGQTLVEQQGEVLSNGLRVPYGGQMRIDETPQKEMRILFLSGLFKDMAGQWTITRGKPLKLTYSLSMDINKSPFPPFLAPRIAEEQVRNWVNVFAAEMERRQRQKGKPT